IRYSMPVYPGAIRTSWARTDQSRGLLSSTVHTDARFRPIHLDSLVINYWHHVHDPADYQRAGDERDSDFGCTSRSILQPPRASFGNSDRSEPRTRNSRYRLNRGCDRGDWPHSDQTAYG